MKRRLFAWPSEDRTTSSDRGALASPAGSRTSPPTPGSLPEVSGRPRETAPTVGPSDREVVAKRLWALRPIRLGSLGPALTSKNPRRPGLPAYLGTPGSDHLGYASGHSNPILV